MTHALYSSVWYTYCNCMPHLTLEMKRIFRNISNSDLHCSQLDFPVTFSMCLPRRNMNSIL